MTELLSDWSRVTFVDRVFIFGFIPATLTLFCLAILSRRPSLPALVLIVASLVFYASWGLKYFAVLTVSLTANFCSGTGCLHSNKGTPLEKGFL